MIKQFSTYLTVLLISFNSFAQGNFEIHFGPSVPLSDFGNDDFDDEDAGGAALGLNVGLKYQYPLTENGLGLFGGIDVFYNGLDSDIKEGYEDLFDSDADITFNRYINIPISAGLMYEFKANEQVSLFGNIGLTSNFLNVTDLVVEVGNDEVTIETDLANTFGYKIGGGILINEKTSIELNYYRLGLHDTNVEVSNNLGYSEKIDSELDVDIFTLTIGFKF